MNEGRRHRAARTIRRIVAPGTGFARGRGCATTTPVEDDSPPEEFGCG